MEMDEPGWAWPAWKFGMKRDDLFGRLHDQYNTFPSTIQDPEAFHHDVYEISHVAADQDDFHRRLAERQVQRLGELNASLELAAIEIIGNPKLIGTEQWQYALQLFRTKSLDSLVRYFMSYLPEGHFYRRDDSTSPGSSFAETCSVGTASTKPSTVDDLDCPSFFTDGEDKPILTHEPFSIINSVTTAIDAQLPLSPRSMTMMSDNSVCSPSDDIDTHDFVKPLTPARTLSFSGSESERFAPAGPECLIQEDDDDEGETSQSDFDTLVNSESDLSESRSSLESALSADEKEHPPTKNLKHDADDEDEYPSAQLPVDMFDARDSETPTPRQELHVASYLDSKPLHRSHRESSPKSPRLRRREGSPMVQGARRSPDVSRGRIQKPLPEAFRMRPKGRRRVD
jgi:hypothetical protein